MVNVRPQKLDRTEPLSAGHTFGRECRIELLASLAASEDAD
jgi:hypothetical protein